MGNVTKGMGFTLPSSNNHINATHLENDTTTGELDSTYTSSFPYKLYQLLAAPENHDAVNWLSHGKAFRVEDPYRFSNEIVPHYFKRKLLLSYLLILQCYETIYCLFTCFIHLFIHNYFNVFYLHFIQQIKKFQVFNDN
jgi:hypothetical protein